MMPFFRLSSPLTRAWAVNREARHKSHAGSLTSSRRPASRCEPTRYPSSRVNSLTQIKFATPPFQKIERHQYAHTTWRDCECGRWFDPESGGAWGMRGSQARHPLCILDEKAIGRWREIRVAPGVVEQFRRGGFLEEGGHRSPGDAGGDAPARP